MENLELYEKGRQVPDNAKREIPAGKLKGKTDINPMWRIKKLTEMFGACGTGWVAPITATWIDEGADGERVVNVKIALKYKMGDTWSEPVDGIGGNTIQQTEKGKLVTNDEAYKMAYTDALSVACKMLGIGADVYWNTDDDKHTKGNTKPEKESLTLEEAMALQFTSKGEIYTMGEMSDEYLHSMSNYTKMPKFAEAAKLILASRENGKR